MARTKTAIASLDNQFQCLLLQLKTKTNNKTLKPLLFLRLNLIFYFMVIASSSLNEHYWARGAWLNSFLLCSIRFLNILLNSSLNTIFCKLNKNCSLNPVWYERCSRALTIFVAPWCTNSSKSMAYLHCKAQTLTQCCSWVSSALIREES